MTLAAFHALPAEEREYLARSPITGGLPLRDVPANWREAYELAAVWSKRPCFICGALGRCKHRQPNVDAAEIEVLKRRKELAA